MFLEDEQWIKDWTTFIAWISTQWLGQRYGKVVSPGNCKTGCRTQTLMGFLTQRTARLYQSLELCILSQGWKVGHLSWPFAKNTNKSSFLTTTTYCLFKMCLFPNSIPGKEDEFFVYGGIGLFNAPLNDAWILKVTESQYSWKYGFLNYDHGEIRCWHGACAFENW